MPRKKGTGVETVNPTITSLGGAASGANSDITSLTGLTTPLPVTEGGNGLATATLGDMRYGSAANTLAALPGNITTTPKYLTQTGDGVNSAAPTWSSALTVTAITNTGLTATRVPYAGVAGLMSDDSGFTRTSLALTLDANTDNTFTTGYGKLGFATSGTSTQFYLAQASNYNSTDFALAQNSAGTTIVNAKTGGSVLLRVNNATRFTLANAAATFPTGVPVTISDTTVSSTTGTGCLILSGGLGVAGAVTVGGNIAGAGSISTSSSSGLASTATTTSFVTSSGNARFYRSGGTITPNSGDLVFQTGDSAARDFIFAAGTTPAIVARIDAKGAVVTAVKAGTPSDADMNTATSGAIIVDTTGSKIWVRVGSTWKSVAVA